MRGTIQEHLTQVEEFVKGSDSGHVTIPEDNLVHSASEGIFKAISEEYTKLVQKYSEYDFSIIREPKTGGIDIFWNRKVDPA